MTEIATLKARFVILGEKDRFALSRKKSNYPRVHLLVNRQAGVNYQ